MGVIFLRTQDLVFAEKWKKNDKNQRKVSLAFCQGLPYNKTAKWLEVVENGAFFRTVGAKT
jgi:hypothetical protein